MFMANEKSMCWTDTKDKKTHRLTVVDDAINEPKMAATFEYLRHPGKEV